MLKRFDELKSLAISAGLISLFALAVTACGSSDADDEGFVRVLPQGPTLEVSNFEFAELKITTQHPVPDLPGALDAWKAFRRASNGLNPVDFELRFYPDHATAIADGVFYADDVSGPDGKVFRTNAAWIEGYRDRQYRQNNAVTPNYMDYVIYGNTIILCGGLSILDSQTACLWMLDRLDGAS